MMQHVANKIASDESTTTGHENAHGQRVPIAALRDAARAAIPPSIGARIDAWASNSRPCGLNAVADPRAGRVSPPLSCCAMKPPHFDEGINGWFVDQMTKNGF